jgi:hypothetical protein
LGATLFILSKTTVFMRFACLLFLTALCAALPRKSFASLEFGAVFVEDLGVRLSWLESLDVNSEYFVIERSPDALNYQFVARIERRTLGQGKPYTYTDFKHLLGTNYYRLRLFSINNGEVGRFVEQVDAYSLANKLLLFPNPNPSGIFTLNAYNTAYETVGLRVFDNFGRLVYERKSFSVPDNWQFELDLSQLADGTYWLYYQSDKRIDQYTYKITILRSHP